MATMDTKTYCARHPKEETAITCASCGTPICPRCMVTAPVGLKCPICARGGNTALYRISPGRLLLAGGASFAAGAAAAIIGELGFFAIFLLLPYGYFAGTVILKASGMKRGRKLEVLAAIGMVAGALALKLVPMVFAGKALANGHTIVSLSLSSLLDPFFLAAVVIATACAVSKIRYI